MIKLSVAAALLLGANAVSTSAKGKSAGKVDKLEDRNINYLEALEAIPPHHDYVAGNNTLAYWKKYDRQDCVDLFNSIINARLEISSSIDRYRGLVAAYDRDCTIY